MHWLNCVYFMSDDVPALSFSLLLYTIMHMCIQFVRKFFDYVLGLENINVCI